MKIKKVPMRSCVVTKERFPKGELIRVVRTPEGKVVIDSSGKINGHGAYLKKDLEVFQMAKQKKVLSRHLEVEIPDSIFEELEMLVK